MAGNNFGNLFRFTTWGESHGPAIGCVVDGCRRASRSPKPTSSPGSTAAARAVALHDAAARERPGPHPLRRLRGQTTGTPILLMIDNEDARSKDYRTRRPLPARPRGFHLLEEIRHPRPSRRRPRLGARDRGARRRRRRRAPGAGHRGDDPRRAGADRAARDRPRPLGLGRDRRQSVLVPRPADGAALGGLSRRRAQGRLLDRRGDRGGGERRAGRARRADLRQARCRPRRAR